MTTYFKIIFTYENIFQMPITGSDPLSVDPFASSFGSLSLSSGDWANFEEDSSGPLQQSSASILSQNKSVASNDSKPFEISIKANNESQSFGQPLANSFNDSSSSMALRNLFGVSGHQTNV
jgi:hypothetical protein